MSSKQGDLSLLETPVAQELLQSKVPARFAYVWTDGTPRVVPHGFHWNGKEIVLGTFPDAPKMKAVKNGTKVAVTIDTDTFPQKVLMIRGTSRVDVVDGIAPEYAAMTKRVFGEEAGQAWLDQMAPICPKMARIFITPEWVGMLDFETRFPSRLEDAMERAQSGQQGA